MSWTASWVESLNSVVAIFLLTNVDTTNDKNEQETTWSKSQKEKQKTPGQFWRDGESKRARAKERERERARERERRGKISVCRWHVVQEPVEGWFPNHKIQYLPLWDLSRQVAVFGAAFTSELGLAGFGGSALNPDLLKGRLVSVNCAECVLTSCLDMLCRYIMIHMYVNTRIYVNTISICTYTALQHMYCNPWFVWDMSNSKWIRNVNTPTLLPGRSWIC